MNFNVIYFHEAKLMAWKSMYSGTEQWFYDI